MAVHILASSRSHLHDRTRIGVALCAAVAPDLDLLLRFVDGRNHHQGASHSIVAAAVAGLAVWMVARLRRSPQAAALGGLAFGAWLSHLVLDYLGKDTHPPIGIPALWPLPGYFKVPIPLFMDIGRTLTLEAVIHNALAVAWELTVLGPVVLLLWRLRTAPPR